MSATDTLDNATTVPVRKQRVLDSLTFFSSHAECYKLGRHAKTPQGREMCRTGRGFSGIQTAPHNLKSRISDVVHLPADTGKGTLCKKNLADPQPVNAVDYPVTCKSCAKLSA